jgi:protein SCO1
MPKSCIHHRSWRTLFALGCVLVFALAVPAAQGDSATPGAFFSAPRTAADFVPDELKNVTVEQHVNSNIPLDLQFVDEDGHPVRLGDYFRSKRPVILQMGYLGCPMLCTLIAQHMADSIKQVGLNIGEDYQYLFVSIDPNEKPDMAKLKKESYEKDYDRPGTAAGWHFLTGLQPQIAQLAATVGFQYKWIESVHQYSHPGVVIILGPDGKICRYLNGITVTPTTLRESVVEASNGQVGTVLDTVFLTCFHYDGTQGQYAWFAIGMMRVGGVLTTLILGSVLIWLHFFRRDTKPLTTAAA